MGKYIDHRLVALPEPDNTFRDDSIFVNASCRPIGGLITFIVFGLIEKAVSFDPTGPI